MREHVERELKLIPGDGFRLADFGEPMPARVFVSTYHDISDLRLARHGITFRHRVEEGTGLWQLKIPSGEARIELEVAGPPARPPSELTACSLLTSVTSRSYALHGFVLDGRA